MNTLPQAALALPLVSCDSPGGTARALISPHGAQVLSWSCDGRERLFLSPLSAFNQKQAIRGGIPVIFPQFGTRGPGTRHGFARLRQWVSSPEAGDSTIGMRLRDDTETRDDWPFSFEAGIEVSLPTDNSLKVAMTVRNTGDVEATFTAALHTYLRVADIARVTLSGLQGSEYLDATQAARRDRQTAELLAFEGEVDRVYLRPGPRLTLGDGGTRLHIEQSGFTDTVVWNPGAALARTMPDLGRHEHFVCVEAACVENPVKIPPGGRWHGSQALIG